MAKLIARLPIHRAPFYFGPEFLSTDSEWQEHFQSLVRSIAEAEGVPLDAVERYGNYALRARQADFWFIIEAQLGTFRGVQDNGLDDDYLDAPPVWTGFEDIPVRFIRRLGIPSSSTTDLSLCPDHIRRQVLRLARGVYDQMQRSFEKALSAGLCGHEARFKLDDADFRPVSGDQLVYYDVAPWDMDEAERDSLNTAISKDRTSTLYSLCVVPAAQDATPRSLEKTSKSAKRGRPVTTDYQSFKEIVFVELSRRGIPSQSSPWNLAALHKRVKGEMGPASPGRSEFYEKISPLIEMFKLEGKTSTIRQSANPKVRAN